MRREKFVTRMGIRAAALALCLALLCFFGGALLRYARPMEDVAYDFSLAWAGEAMPENWVYDQKGWSVFTLEDGERNELTANAFGGFSGDAEPGGVFYFSRVLSEAVDAPTLQIDASERAIAVFLDGKCLYSDGAMDAVIGEVELAELGWKRGAPLLVPLPGDYLGKELTIAQSAGATEGAPSTIYPCAVSLTCGYAYESGLIAESFGTAIFRRAAVRRRRMPAGGLRAGRVARPLELGGAVRGAVPPFVDGGPAGGYFLFSQISRSNAR